MKRIFSAKKITVAVLCIGLSLGIWAFWIEPASITVSKHSITVPNWPEACTELQVAVLADLHVGSPYNGIDHLEEIVSATNLLGADLILLPGDFVIQGVVGGEFVSPEDAARTLSKLSAPMGVYAVLGNHDYWLDAVRVTKALESANIPVLEDRSLPIRKGQCELSLVGVSDFTEGKHDVNGAIATAPSGTPNLLFAHNPDVFPDIPERVLLTIAGHTHGGQVYFPGIGRPIVPSKYGERYAIGLIRENGKTMFVSSGVGTSIIPVRFLVPPEITVLRVGVAKG